MRQGDYIILLELLQVVYCFIFYKKMKLHSIHFFSWSIFLIFCIELFIRFFFQKHDTNHLLHNYFDLLQFLLWAILFYQNTNYYKKTIKIISTISFLFFLINLLFIENKTGSLTTHSFALNSIAISIFAILYFYETLAINGNFNFLQKPLIWIAFGAFFNSLITAPYFAMYNYLDASYDKLYSILDSIVYVISIFSLLFTIIGLLLIHKLKINAK